MLFNKNHRTSSILDEVLLLVNILIKRLILLYLNCLEFDLLDLLKDQSRLLFLVTVTKVLDNILLNFFYNRMSLLLLNALLNCCSFLDKLLRLLLLLNENGLFLSLSFLLLSETSLLLSPDCCFLSFLS